MSRKKDAETLQTNPYILTFNTPKIPKELKVETYISNLLRCYNCQKFGQGKEKCTRTPVCVRSRESDANHTNCEQDSCCPNCGKKHSAKDWEMWKKEKEILRIKYMQNIPFLESRKIEATKYADVSKKNIPNTSLSSCQKSKTSESTPTIINKWYEKSSNNYKVFHLYNYRLGELSL